MTIGKVCSIFASSSAENGSRTNVAVSLWRFTVLFDSGCLMPMRKRRKSLVRSTSMMSSTPLCPADRELNDSRTSPKRISKSS